MTTVRADLGAYSAFVSDTLARLGRENVTARVSQGDYTLWKPQPTEITNRLGWLDVANRMTAALPEITGLVNAVRADGYTDALVLGMGGSSLAPEVFRQTFGVAAGYLDLAVLDSTDPDAVAAHARRLDPARTLFVVSTKSGGTVETFSFFRYFYRWVVRALGTAAAGRHFIAITDPGSGLVGTASQYGFRHTFLNDPNIGGRYSALSHFGLVPAALVGADVPQLLQRATAMERALEPAAQLGATIGELATRGRDKLTFALSAPVAGFSSWVEQLIAESTGKEGKGILPVAGEPLGPPAVYGDDRVFVYLRVGNDATHDAAIDALRAAGHPVLRIDLADPYDIGGEFVRWEMATAVIGWRLGINPFDQPNVESAKVLARTMVKSYETSGALPAIAPTGHGDGLTVYTAAHGPGAAGTAHPANPADLVREFLRGVRPGNYIALQAYVTPSAETTAALQRWRVALRDRLHVATTVGYGPRFLHSTGQLHKGDAGNGVFIQIVTAPPAADVPIPDTADADTSHMTFGVLKVAQSLGDRQALLDAGRRVLRVDPDHASDGIARLTGLLP
ncbi:MAG: glucose-6-phosphate isomerase [Gemmatimonadales bacterium]